MDNLTLLALLSMQNASEKIISDKPKRLILDLLSLEIAPKDSSMKFAKLLMPVIVLMLMIACNDEPVETEKQPEFPSTAGLSGFVQKGPFVAGSNIIVQVLDEEFNPTGQSYTVTTVDDFGSFELESKITGTYV